MSKTNKILLWTLGGLVLAGGAYLGYQAYRKYRTSSNDPDKNNRKIIQNLVN